MEASGLNMDHPAIRYAVVIGTAALLRNKFAHHYPEVTQSRIDRLNLLPLEASFVLEAFSEIEEYLLRKKFV